MGKEGNGVWGGGAGEKLVMQVREIVPADKVKPSTLGIDTDIDIDGRTRKCAAAQRRLV